MPFATLTGNSSRIRFALDGSADQASPWSVRVSRPFAVPVGTARGAGFPQGTCALMLRSYAATAPTAHEQTESDRA